MCIGITKRIGKRSDYKKNKNTFEKSRHEKKHPGNDCIVPQMSLRMSMMASKAHCVV